MSYVLVRLTPLYFRVCVGFLVLVWKWELCIIENHRTRHTVARSRNHSCNIKATTFCVFTAESGGNVNNIKILSNAQKCFHGEFVTANDDMYSLLHETFPTFLWSCNQIRSFVTFSYNFTFQNTNLVHNYFNLQQYTGCPRRNGQNFGRVFLMLNYTDITQNTYFQSWTVTEIMAWEKCGLLGCPRTVRRPWRHTHNCACPATRHR